MQWNLTKFGGVHFNAGHSNSCRYMRHLSKSQHHPPFYPSSDIKTVSLLSQVNRTCILVPKVHPPESPAPALPERDHHVCVPEIPRFVFSGTSLGVCEAFKGLQQGAGHKDFLTT